MATRHRDQLLPTAAVGGSDRNCASTLSRAATAAPGQRGVDPGDGLGVPDDVEVGLRAPPAGLPEPFAPVGIAQQGQEGVRHGPRVARRDQEAAVAVRDDLGDTARAAADMRDALINLRYDG